MKPERVYFTFTIWIAIAVGLYIPSCQFDHHDLLSLTPSGSISLEDGDDLLTKRYCDVVSPKLNALWKEHTDPKALEDQKMTQCDATEKEQKVVSQRRLRMQRRSLIQPPDNEPTPWERRMESPNPTDREMRLFLSPGEMEDYHNHWRAGKQWRRTWYQIERGNIILTEEEEKEFAANKESYNKAARLMDYVTRELVRTNRARPAMMKSYEDTVRRRRVTHSDRRKELRSLIDNDLANPDEVAEYETLMKKVQRVNQTTAKWGAERKRERLAWEHRMQELEKLFKDNAASDAEHAEYEDLSAKLQAEKDKASRDYKIWHAKQKNRMQELERLIKSNVASDAERAEYDEVKVILRANREEKIQAFQKWKTKRKNRMQELERLIRDDLATSDAERAELAALTAEDEAKKASATETDRIYRAKQKERMEELERLIKDDAASEAERAEYDEMKAKRRGTIDKIVQASKKRKTKKKNRMQELEGLVKDDLASDAERAELVALMAEEEVRKASAAEARLRHAAKRKKRMEELEKLIKDDAASEAEVAEYKSMKEGKRQEYNENRNRKKRKDKQEGSKKGQSKSPTETGPDQALQSTTNPHVGRMDAFLGRLGKLWQASSRVPNKSWNIPSLSQVARPIAVPFGVTP